MSNGNHAAATPSVQSPSSPMTNRHAVIAPLWTVKDVATYLGVPVQTLYSWRQHGAGPTARRVGKHLRYRPADVERWLDSLDEGVA